MAKTAKKMSCGSKRMHRGGDAHLSPAALDAEAPVDDVMESGSLNDAAPVSNEQPVAADLDKKALEELGFNAGDANQSGGKKHKHGGKKHSRKHHKRGGKKHSRKTHKHSGKKHSRKHHKRGGKKYSCKKHCCKKH